MADFSIAECDATLAKHLDDIKSGKLTFYQTWTCFKCKERVTGDTPNKLFILGHHEGPCGYVTDLEKAGCNYMIHIKVGGQK